MAWLYLVLAGMMEWGWPMGLKFAWTDHGVRPGPAILAVISILASGFFLLLAQRTIPIGTAYAVWTGIGAVGTFMLGILLLDEPATLGRFVFAGCIVIGIIGLKLVTEG
ncbi:MAG: QacE family quaternary ammonium compound efflux SMR transporter [Nitrospirae bacterium]|nr:MAG: QacE family quaternary ammonium compound efflux SMR transporter [Nitrospirota bacterium]